MFSGSFLVILTICGMLRSIIRVVYLGIVHVLIPLIFAISTIAIFMIMLYALSTGFLILLAIQQTLGACVNLVILVMYVNGLNQ